MIRQQIGDLLEIEYEGNFFYLVILTKIVQFGGNMVFAHHTDGSRQSPDEMIRNRAGFNICTDLLPPKREGKAKRLHRFIDVEEFWLSKFVKGTNEHRLGHRAKLWYLYSIDDLRNHIRTYRRLPKKYRNAMDDGTYSFDITADKILAGYTPDKNQHL